MRDEIADVVFPVLREGLVLRQRLQAKHKEMVADDWRQKLLGLLQSPPRSEEALADYWPDHAYGSGMAVVPHYDSYLGIRYALTCWLDEIMIQENLPWHNYWSNNKLETQLYGDSLRAVEFWNQADRAEHRQPRDALEVYYLCVMLGFRGSWEGRNEQFTAWRDRVRTEITRERDFGLPAPKAVEPDVPPLLGARRKKKMLFYATVTALVLVPVVVFTIIALFS